MRPPTVIIPSSNAGNLSACVAAVHRHEPTNSICIVDDGIDWARMGKRPSGLEVWKIDGVHPFVFARNCNRGIKACGGEGDVVLLNDDAVLETHWGFTGMQKAAAADPTLGIVVATTNIASNADQYPQGTIGMRIARRSPGFTFPAVAFVCVLIPGRTLETVGLLDERFTAYGWEDTDYCRRVHDAGLRIGIFDGCFVDHSKLTSTFRGQPRDPGPIEEGRRIYIEKWGHL
jgi:GT2 family glycosyltransferase